MTQITLLDNSEGTSHLKQIIVEIPPTFSGYVDAALMRLRYLYPAAQFNIAGQTVTVVPGKDDDRDTVGRDVQYTLYREKIYQETLPLRRMLIQAVTET